MFVLKYAWMGILIVLDLIWAFGIYKTLDNYYDKMDWFEDMALPFIIVHVGGLFVASITYYIVTL